MARTPSSSAKDRKQRTLLTVAIAFVTFGLFLALHLFGPSDGVLSSGSRGDESISELAERNAMAIAALESALAAEAQQRREIADRLAELNAELAQRRSASEGGAAASDSGDDDRTRTGSDDANEADPDEEAEAPAFDAEALIAAGVDSREVDRLRDLWVQQELDRAQIAYDALREGWFFTARHRTELSELDRALRDELTDEDYDRFLYARGDSNRLKAVDVLDGGAASRAGLRSGDIIVRYDGVRVFKSGDILNVSTAGEPGESVPVQILRDDRIRTVYVRRGPLGVIVKSHRGSPISD